MSESMWEELHTPEGFVRLEDGSICEHDVLNIIKQVSDYDENLKVQYLERAAAAGDAPWRIIERCRDGEYRVIFYAWKMDGLVLDRIRAADCYSLDVFSAMDSHNEGLRRLEGRRFRERMDEAKDIVEHIIKSPKGRYTFKNPAGDLVTLDDDKKPSWKVEEK